MDTAHGVFGEDSDRDSGNRIGFSDSYGKGLHWSMAKGVDIVANLIVRVLYLLCTSLCMMVILVSVLRNLFLLLRWRSKSWYGPLSVAS